MAADNVFGALFAALGEAHFPASQLNQFHIGHAAQHADRVGLLRGANAFHVCGRTLFAANPNLFQQMVETLLILF